MSPALPVDAAALTVLERVANLAALGHVFPPAEYPFPTEGVLDRWQRVLADPDVRVEVERGPSRLDCFVAYDATTIRHLAVHPDRWGSGLARAAVDRAVAAIRAGGEQPRLWCLTENRRARGFYEHLGWTPTGATQLAEWPPYPVEMEYVLGDSSHGG